MKKFLLTMLCAVGLVTAASAEPVTVTWNFTENDYGLERKSGNVSDGYLEIGQSLTQDGAKITFGDANNSWRLWTDGLREYYKNSPTFTVSAPGYVVTKVEWTVVSGATFKVDGTDGNVTSWEGSAESVKFIGTASDNKAVKTITVTYDEGNGQGGNEGGDDDKDDPVTPPTPGGEGNEVTFDFKASTYGAGPAYSDASTAYVTSNNVATQGAVSVKFTGSSNTAWRFWSDGIRAYKNQSSTFTVSANGGKVTEVSWTTSNNGATFALTSDASKNITSWEGSEDEVSFVYTNTSNNYALVTLTVKYEGAEAPAVEMPDITCTDNLVTITAEEGADIYYTIDGTEPSKTSTKYTVPFAITATTVVKAIAYVGEDASAVRTFTATYEGTYANFAEFIEAGEGTVNGPLTVVYQNGSYLYVVDSTNYPMLVYGSINTTLENGDQIASIKGKYAPYKNLPELTNPVIGEVTKAVTTVDPAVIAISGASKDNVNSYVKLENVTLDANKNITDRTGSIALYNRFTGIDLPTDYDKTYNVTGFVSIFDATLQIYPTEFEEVVVAPEPTITLGEVTVSEITSESAVVTVKYEAENVEEPNKVFVDLQYGYTKAPREEGIEGKAEFKLEGLTPETHYDLIITASVLNLDEDYNLVVSDTKNVGFTTEAAPVVEPTNELKLVWKQENFDTKARGDIRQATGFGGKVYFSNKNGDIKSIDKDGNIEDFATVSGIGFGISSDDKGNILVNKGQGGDTGGGQNFKAIKADGSESYDFSIDLASNAGITVTRTDFISRVVGDLFSVDGAYFYLAESTYKKVVLAYVRKNDEGKIYTITKASNELSYAFDSTTLAHPLLTFEEIEASEQPENNFYVRLRGNKYVTRMEDGTAEALPQGNANTKDGFGAFRFNGVDIQMLPAKIESQYNYGNEYQILIDGEVIGTYKLGNETDDCKSGGHFSAVGRAINDTQAEIYVFASQGGTQSAAMYTYGYEAPASVSIEAVEAADIAATSANLVATYSTINLGSDQKVVVEFSSETDRTPIKAEGVNGKAVAPLTGLAQGTSYKYQAIAYLTDAEGNQDYTTRTKAVEVDFTTLVAKLEVSNIAVSTPNPAGTMGTITVDVKSEGVATADTKVYFRLDKAPYEEDRAMSYFERMGNYTFDMTGLTPGTTYTATVYAVNGAVMSEEVTKEFTTPSLPVELVNFNAEAENVTATTADIVVTYTVNNATATTKAGAAYQEYSEFDYHEVEGDLTGLTISLENLEPDTEYTYYVHPTLNGNPCGMDLEVTFTTEAAAPAVPENLYIYYTGKNGWEHIAAGDAGDDTFEALNVAIYAAEGEENGYVIFSTVDSEDWDAINEGAVGAEEEGLSIDPANMVLVPGSTYKWTAEPGFYFTHVEWWEELVGYLEKVVLNYDFGFQVKANETDNRASDILVPVTVDNIPEGVEVDLYYKLNGSADDFQLADRVEDEIETTAFSVGCTTSNTNHTFTLGNLDNGQKVKVDVYAVAGPDKSEVRTLEMDALTGVNGITVDGDDNAVYYNLQGIRIDRPVSGTVVIRVNGNDIQKVTVK